MARINRSDVIQKAVNDLAISTSTDKIPNETLDKVQLTYDLNKKFSNFAVSIQSTITGAAPIVLPTINSSSDIYITGVAMGLIKDATCDIADGNVALSTIGENGITIILARIPILTLTAQSENIFYSFPYPLKIKTNSATVFTVSFTVGKLSRFAIIYGFTTSSN